MIIPLYGTNHFCPWLSQKMEVVSHLRQFVQEDGMDVTKIITRAENLVLLLTLKREKQTN